MSKQVLEKPFDLTEFDRIVECALSSSSTRNRDGRRRAEGGLQC